MTDLHPITLPRELVTDWCKQWAHENDCGPTSLYDIATKAAHWGADQELEACCEWCADESVVWAQELRAARRPKPPSLKEEALQVLEALIESRRIVDPEYQALRHALEQLND